MLVLILSLIGCGPSLELDITGTVMDKNFSPVTAFWGQTMISFVDVEMECIDMYWVDRVNINGEDSEAGTDYQSMQITFLGDGIDLIVAGTHTEGGNAPINAQFISSQEGVLSVVDSTEGSLNLDEVAGEENPIAGAFNFNFNDGASGNLSGNFAGVEWCQNIRD